MIFEPVLKALTLTQNTLLFFLEILITQVDYISCADEIAVEVGCKPNLWWLLIRDPSLALKCIFRGCTPPQFRLMGPGAWQGAKKAIEDARSNVVYATKTRSLPKKDFLVCGFGFFYSSVLRFLRRKF